MRCVNPNVSEEEEISDSAKHRVPVFPPTLPLFPLRFWPTGRADDNSVFDRKRRSEDERGKENPGKRNAGRSNAAWLKFCRVAAVHGPNKGPELCGSSTVVRFRLLSMMRV